MNRRSNDQPSRLWIWLMRQALLFHPPRLRAEYGREIEDVFRARVANADGSLGGRKLLGFQLREVRGVVRTGLLSRWENWKRSRSQSPNIPTHPRNPGPMNGSLADLSFALRSLRKSPGFTLSAVLILALGIGANITAFSALNVAVLAPPPFPEADRLVSVDLTRGTGENWRISRWAYPYLQRYVDWPDRLISPLAGYRQRVATLTGYGPASQLNIEVVSPEYFDVVGRPLVLGRGFVSDEADPNGPYRVTVISYGFWQTRLGGDPGALGREIELNAERFAVIGVAPQGFSGFAGGADLWLPLGAYAVIQPGVLQQAGNHVAWVIGRLRPGTTMAAAEAQMAVVGQAISQEWPRGDDSYAADVRALAEVWTNPDARKASVFLALAAGLVLLVACANLAGLLFTRARRRVREGAVRSALGASRWRLIRSYLIESMTIATVGGAAGLGLSMWGMRFLTIAWPTQFLRGDGTGLQVISPESLTVDSRMIFFAVGVSLCAALLIGLLPAIRISSFRITDHLKDGSGATRPGATKRRGSTPFVDPQALLVGAQVSLALMLLVGVGLMGSSVRQLLAVDEGFQTERLLSFDFSTPQAVPRMDPRDPEIWRHHITLSALFDDQIQERLTNLPGVEGVTMSSGAALSDFQAVLGVIIEDSDLPSAEGTSIGVVPVADNYFDLLGIPVVSGRVFNRSDDLNSPPVVVLSQSAVERYFPDQNPIGNRVTTYFALPGRATAEVIGVVGDVIYTGPEEDRWPVAYYSLRDRRFGGTATVRTTSNPHDVTRMIQEELYALDPTVAMSNINTVNQLISRSVGDRGLVFWLLVVFASVTVLLAAVGTWGVVAYSVADRQRELGLRMALGAKSGNVLGLVLRRSVWTALAGVLVGLGGAWAGSRVLEAMLWNTSARDLRVFLGGGALLFGIVLAASYLPALRATRVDPVEVLKAAE